MIKNYRALLVSGLIINVEYLKHFVDSRASILSAVKINGLNLLVCGFDGAQVPYFIVLKDHFESIHMT